MSSADQLAAASAEIARLRAQLDAANAEGNRVVGQLQQAQAAAAAAAVAAAAVPAPARVSSKLKAPPAPVFRGEVGAAADTWLRGMRKQFEFYGDSEFPTDAARIRYAALHLEGSALLWWEAHPQRDTIATLAEFEAALHQRFRPIEAPHVARERLATMKQRGRVSDYADRFQRELMPIKDMTEADQVAYFLRGLDAHLQAKAREKKPSTLGAAINAAVEAEAYARDGRPFVGHGHGYGQRHYGSGAAPSSASAAARSDGAVPMDLNQVGLEDLQGPLDPREQEAQLAADPLTVTAAAGGTLPSRSPGSDNTAVLLAMMQDMQQRLNAMSSGPPRNGSRGPSAASSRPAGSDRVPGLSREDIDRLRREGRCFKCKKPGHTKRECTEAPRLKW